MKYPYEAMKIEPVENPPWNYYKISAWPGSPRLDTIAWDYERMLEIVEEFHEKGYKVQVNEITEREVYKD